MNQKTEFIPKLLPLLQDFHTKEILLFCITANKALAELKGLSNSLPNPNIIINTLALREAKESSAIENIITTHDELFRSETQSTPVNQATKEVQNYKRALFLGVELVSKNGFLSIKHIKSIQSELEQNSAGFRKQAGTVLKNPQTGEIKYTPPQNPKDIEDLMANLVEYINAHDIDGLDPLIKMALIHYQFEAIHPFYDGNGRTGRIINILYLMLGGLLNMPILYLSRYIIQNKADYYTLLNRASFDDGMREWVLFLLRGVEITSKETISIIKNIETLMQDAKVTMETKAQKIYSKELLESIFYHPYTKIAFLEESLKVTRKTASSYLKELENLGILSAQKIGREIFYINTKLFELLQSE